MTRIRRKLFGQIESTRERGYYGAFGYNAVMLANNEKRKPVGGSGAQHQENYRVDLINQSRDFQRNNGIYAGMIERAVGYIIGNGFQLQMKTGNDEVNSLVEKLWRDFWRSPEVRGVLCGRDLERQVCRELLIAGDTGVILTSLGKLQHVEAEQIASKNFSNGIRANEYGAPLEFFVAPYGKYGTPDTAKAVPVSVADMCFLAQPERPSSIRGVPPCQAAFPMIHRINDVCDSEAVAWQMLARFAVAVTREAGAEQAYNESMADDKKSSDGLDGDAATRISELDYALIFHGNPGDKVEGIEHNVPGQNFTESLMMFLRLLGLPLGLPLEIILLDWTRSNYSQSRAVLEQAYQAFLGRQLLIEDGFLDRALAWKLIEWQAIHPEIRKLFPDTLDVNDVATWIKPSFPWIDQLQEAEAYGEKLDRGFATHTEVCKSLGQERADVVRIREQEIVDAINTAKRIEQSTGVAVDYKIFAGLKSEGGEAIPNREMPVTDEAE